MSLDISVSLDIFIRHKFYLCEVVTVFLRKLARTRELGLAIVIVIVKLVTYKCL
jgi:hypothetical protein